MLWAEVSLVSEKQCKGSISKSGSSSSRLSSPAVLWHVFALNVKWHPLCANSCPISISSSLLHSSLNYSLCKPLRTFRAKTNQNSFRFPFWKKEQRKSTFFVTNFFLCETFPGSICESMAIRGWGWGCPLLWLCNDFGHHIVALLFLVFLPKALCLPSYISLDDMGVNGARMTLFIFEPFGPFS